MSDQILTTPSAEERNKKMEDINETDRDDERL